MTLAEFSAKLYDLVTQAKEDHIPGIELELELQNVIDLLRDSEEVDTN